MNKFVVAGISGLLAIAAIGGTVNYMGHNTKSTSTSKEHSSKSSSSQSSAKASSASSSSTANTGSSSSSSTSKSTSSQASHSSEANVLNASGTAYDIKPIGGIGGAGAKPTPMTQLMDEHSALDVVASIPGFNHSQLVSATQDGDSWKIAVNQNGVSYNVSLTHFYEKTGIIQVAQDGSAQRDQYSFVIPENLYAPYRQAEKAAQDEWIKNN
ncbi:hypothetical protein [Convivina intestini]|uniref:hypothetical protein n=1 Tax=Convivina intestini TaxID=1505726 RepID=UPI00200BD2C8|nr:hypothetical protein [Convivina intestini]CAH1857042.1 hypothetical protein R078131_01525 [Convivina intestini]